MLRFTAKLLGCTLLCTIQEGHAPPAIRSGMVVGGTFPAAMGLKSDVIFSTNEPSALNKACIDWKKGLQPKPCSLVELVA